MKMALQIKATLNNLQVYVCSDYLLAQYTRKSANEV